VSAQQNRLLVTARKVQAVDAVLGELYIRLADVDDEPAMCLLLSQAMEHYAAQFRALAARHGYH
jgi:hypothetical protein